MFPASKTLLLALSAGLLASPALARQDEPLEPATSPQAVTPDMLVLARQAATRGDNAEALSRYLRILSTAPDDVAALTGAGQAALGVGDINAAAGFFSRADALESKNGAVKAGLAETLLANGNAGAALRLFNEAVALGIDQADIAVDRGLAYDLRGSPKRAQADYGLAMRTHPSDEVTRRMALSYAFAGDRQSALATLDPLLRKQDRPAWRDRIFIYAMTGDLADAQHDAAILLPPDQVAELTPYLPRLAGLRASDKAAAIHLGRFPGDARKRPAPAPAQIATASALAPAASVPAQTFAEVQAAALARATPRARTRASSRAPAAETASPALVASPPEAERGQQKQAREDAALQAKDAARDRAAEKKAQQLAAQKARELAEKKAQQEKEAEARAVARKNPARHWVQVAGGANKADLGKEWAKLKAKWPTQLAGKSPWTLHYRFTNRLLIGPFPTSDAAQDWVTARRKEGLATFRVETSAGDPVERVD